MTTFINFNGDNGAGKSTACLYLHSMLIKAGYSAKVIHLADTVKKICALLVNESAAKYYTEEKEALIESIGITRRQLMLDVTKFGMSIHKDIFFERAIKYANNFDFILIGDARYKEWEAYLTSKQLFYYNVYVSRDCTYSDKADFIIFNENDNADYLFEQYKQLLHSLTNTYLVK